MSTLDLFPTREGHDPGGRVRLRPLPGVEGRAFFSECRRYRPLLIRKWDDGEKPTALWIGMNPSTADANVDDPTVRREIDFTRRLGLQIYVKCNVMDYRATDPKALLAPGVVPSSPENLPTIREQAAYAEKVIVCWGALPKSLRRFALAVEQQLNDDGIAMWCLGRTQDGSPRHPLYVRGDTPLERFA